MPKTSRSRWDGSGRRRSRPAPGPSRGLTCTGRGSWAAAIVMAPVLTVVADFVGIVGGWMVAALQLQVATGVYWASIFQGLFMQDVWMGLIKPFFLGFVIVTVACHVGLRTSGGTEGVGRATTRAVVAGSVGVIAVDFFVTKILVSLLY